MHAAVQCHTVHACAVVSVERPMLPEEDVEGVVRAYPAAVSHALVQLPSRRTALGALHLLSLVAVRG